MKRAVAFAAALIAAATVLSPARAGDTDAAAQAARIGRGINILDGDPIWDDRAKTRFQVQYFARIHDGGFQTVRVALHGFAHMDADNRLDPNWLATLDWVIANARAAHLNVILDEHDHTPCGKDAAACRPRLMAFWRQVAARCHDQPDDVFFEILNEPNGELTPVLWNAYFAEALAIVRATNPTRAVIVGPTDWNSIDRLNDLVLPANDRNLIVTVHYYTPMRFTHQGASWAPGMEHLSGITWGTPEEKARVARDFDAVQKWADAHRRPIFLGEFGAYDTGDMASRARYASTVARAAEAHHWPWAWWQFTGDFVAFDVARSGWVPAIHDALVPPTH